MSELVYVLGMSNGGKSTSIGKSEKLKIKGLNPKNTAIINCDGKRLLFDNANEWSTANKNLVITKDFTVIRAMLLKLKERSDIKNVVIDDFQYCTTDYFATGIGNKVGLGLYTDIFNEVLRTIDMTRSLRDDQLVFLTNHLEEYNSNGIMRKRFKAVGDALHKHVTPEGKSNVVLYAEGEMIDKSVRKFFRTMGDSITDSCKTPSGMFTDEKGNDLYTIPNDLGYVEDCIRKAWNI